MACINSFRMPLGRLFHVGGNKLIRLKSREPLDAFCKVLAGALVHAIGLNLTEPSNVSEKVLLELEAFFDGVRVKECCTHSFATLFEVTLVLARTLPLAD